MLECVMNISEGRDPAVIAAVAAAAGPSLLDVHTDPDHHRSVLTVVGDDAPRAVARTAIELIDLTTHVGAHPRLGVVDVVPFVALGSTPVAEAIGAREEFGRWLAEAHGVPGFRYGSRPSLPEVRREAFTTRAPDWGPPRPHPTAGASAIGARPLLVAYNVWLADTDLARARSLAAGLRGPAVRALGLAVGERVQVSMNLVAPEVVGPAEVYDRIAAVAEIDRAELVGLVPTSVLAVIDPVRWPQLDLSIERTIEARLEAAGLRAD